jgi:hypothetical protein
LLKEIIGVNYKTNETHKHSLLGGKNSELTTVKAGGHTVTTGLWGINYFNFTFRTKIVFK